MTTIISIIIPTKDRKVVFERTLISALQAIEGIDAEIIIINDSKGQEIILPVNDDRIRVFNNTKGGVASARNLGAAHAKSDLILFLDNDIIIHKENILVTLGLCKQNKTGCYNLNWVYPPDLETKMKKTQFGRYLIHNGYTSLKGWNRGNLSWNDEKTFETNLVASYYLPIYKDVFEKAGKYDEAFPHSGAEDHDFANRLKKSGVKAFIVPSSMVYHNEADRMELDKWMTRNRNVGETRRIAVGLGYDEVKLVIQLSKLRILKICLPFLGLFNFSLKLIPNLKFFDGIYFRIMNLLLMGNLWIGYQRGENK